MQHVISTIVFLLIFLTASGQNYDRDIGFRGLLPNGISYRKHQDMENALEAVLQFSNDGVRLFGLKEHFKPVLLEYSDNITFVYGWGIHVGAVRTRNYSILQYKFLYSKKKFSPSLGLAGIGGFEYHFREFPLIAGVEIKPFFEYSTFRFFNVYLGEVSLTVKYRF